ncbi:MAG TPA: hypothetical protein VI589_04775, partial [Vicinamibacteria bacterium]
MSDPPPDDTQVPDPSLDVTLVSDPSPDDTLVGERGVQAKEGTRPFEAIGPYRLLQRLGVGGMGEVWLADQTGPVQRQVALKVIKAGMDTAQVVARFEAE